VLRACSARGVGENIAYGALTADQVMAMWMRSRGHRANILRPASRTSVSGHDHPGRPHLRDAELPDALSRPCAPRGGPRSRDVRGAGVSPAPAGRYAVRGTSSMIRASAPACTSWRACDSRGHQTRELTSGPVQQRQHVVQRPPHGPRRRTGTASRAPAPATGSRPAATAPGRRGARRRDGVLGRSRARMSSPSGTSGAASRTQRERARVEGVTPSDGGPAPADATGGQQRGGPCARRPHGVLHAGLEVEVDARRSGSAASRSPQQQRAAGLHLLGASEARPRNVPSP
jgi:hypothetical protein